MESLKDFMAKQRKAADRKQARADKRMLLGPKFAQNRPNSATGRTKRRPKPSARKTAFLRLKALVKLFVLLRAKKRSFGLCEVGVLCGGRAPASLPYHVFPAATGNAIKYDPRNILGACPKCNGGEYFDRKRGTYDRWNLRHLEILGPEVMTNLKAMAGRKQIPTREAVSMADALKAKIENQQWDEEMPEHTENA